MTSFDVRVRAAARELDRPDALAEFLAYRAVEDSYRDRTATPEDRAALDAAVRSWSAAAAPVGVPVTGPPPSSGTEPGARPADQTAADVDLGALADAAVAGSATAREELAVRLWPMLARYCAARLGATARTDGASAVALDAVVQDVLRTVLDGLPDRGERSVPAFAYMVAARCTTTHQRSASDGSHLTASGSAALLDACRALPRAQRDVLVLRVLLGCSAEETAEHLGTTPGAVRVAQHRALTTVRRAGAAGV